MRKSSNEKKEKQVASADSSIRAVATFPPPDHSLLTVPKKGHLLSIIPVELFVMSIATRLDLRSLGAFTCVSSVTHDLLNEDITVWNRMMLNMGVNIEGKKQEKTGALYKERCRLFHLETVSFYNFFVNSLPAKLDEVVGSKTKTKFRDNVTLPEIVQLHKTIIDARRALVNFLENPQQSFKTFFQMKLAIYKLIPELYIGYKTPLLDILLTRYDTIDISLEGKSLIAKFVAVFVENLKLLFDFPDIYTVVNSNFAVSFGPFAYISIGDRSDLELPDNVAQSDPVWQRAFQAIHECVKVVDPESASLVQSQMHGGDGPERDDKVGAATP